MDILTSLPFPAALPSLSLRLSRCVSCCSLSILTLCMFLICFLSSRSYLISVFLFVFVFRISLQTSSGLFFCLFVSLFLIRLFFKISLQTSLDFVFFYLSFRIFIFYSRFCLRDFAPNIIRSYCFFFYLSFHVSLSYSPFCLRDFAPNIIIIFKSHLYHFETALSSLISLDSGASPPHSPLLNVLSSPTPAYKDNIAPHVRLLRHSTTCLP